MLRSSLVWKLTIWFLLLSLLPIGVIVLFIRQDVSEEFMNLAKEDTGSQVSLLANEIASSIDDRELESILADATNETQVAFLLGEDGAYVFHGDASKMGSLISDDFSAEVVRSVRSGTKGVIVEEDSGRLIGFSGVPTAFTKAVLAVDNSVVSTPMSKIERAAFVQLALSLALISIAGGVAIWVMFGPIQQLTRAAQEIGAGNLDVTVDPSKMEGELEILTTAFNQMTQQVSGRTRELKTLEELGRAIINGPPDASTLSEIVTEHVPIMFPDSRIDVRIFPDQTLYSGQGVGPPVDSSVWGWLATASEARCFMPGDQFPWDGAPGNDAVVAVPILDLEAQEPIGGIHLSLGSDPDAAPNLLPAVLSLAAQIASALHMARVYGQELAHETIAQELALAGQIQESFLSADLPDVPGWQLAAMLRPARETSGDFYDVIPLPGGRLGILIADVADKGMGAALYMALSRTLIRTYAVEHETQPELALSAANHRILADTGSNLFVTVFYGVFDPASGALTYSNAGHNPPYLLSAGDGNAISELERTGVPLGIIDGMTWQQKSTQINPGDILLFYTDGITEAQDAQEAFFDEDRVQDFIRANLGRSADDIQTDLIAQVDTFVGAAPQFDDITLLVVVRRAVDGD
ncbi:MAG: SpoIIE family protein phosphatase [SAR202 cluster bacterium]|jgi:serine phosphatase RsbU (regulator of sigma subunit)/HAMP domain-containing protein|nr:SpoIIE family protein phosphatase [SAR202 cluster bacterium]